MRRFVVISIVLASIFVSRGARAQQPVWRTEIGDDYQGMAVSATGALIVQTKTNVIAISTDSGKKLWSLADATGVGLLPGVRLALVRVDNRQRVIDLGDGKERWNFGSLSLADPVRSVVLPEHGLVLAYGPSSKSRMTLFGVTLDSGVIRWRQDSLLPATENKLQQIAQHVKPVIVGDSAVVLDVDEGGLVSVRLSDGAVLWRVADAVIDLDKAAGPLRVIGGTLYVPYEKKLAAIDPASGALRWKRTQDFPGAAERLEPSSAGLVVGGAFLHTGWTTEPRIFLDVVDPGTGASRWTKPVEIKGVSPFLVRGDTIFQPVHGAFRAFDAASGRTLAESDVPSLGGGEEPRAIEEAGDGDLVLVSPQSLLKVDPTGRTKYHRYLKAPGSSLLTKVAAVSLSVALTAASGMPSAFYPATHHATLNENQYAYIYTGDLAQSATDTIHTGGFDLVRLDKRYGSEKGRVRLEDRTPKYVVDPVTGAVIVVHGRELWGYRFPGP